MAPYTGGGPFQEQVSMPSEQACCSPYYSVLRFFSHSLPKGTVSATINIVALSFMAASVEVARWVYFRGWRQNSLSLPSALIAGIVVIMLVSRLLKLRQQHLLQPA